MFVFVDGLGNSYSSKATRSHVMTNAYRDKRKALNKTGSGSKATLEPKTRTFELRAVHPIDRLDEEGGFEYSQSEPSFSYPSSPSSFPTFCHTAEDGVAHIAAHPSFQPRTILSAGLVDHLCTLPVARDPIVDDFVAAYLGPPYDYGMGKRPSMAFNYRRARFRASLTDACSFYAMLAWLGRRAQMLRDSRMMFHAMHFKGRCMSLMTEQLQTRDTETEAVGEGMMYSALDLPNGELRNGDYIAAISHWEGLRNMVAAHGGLHKLTHNVPLIYSILWNYMALGLDQGIYWSYIPPTCALGEPLSATSSNETCVSALFAFIGRLQDPSTRQFLAKAAIVSAVSSPMAIYADLLLSTIEHLFVAMENVLKEIDFDWYPYDLETVLTYLIRGIDLLRVDCPVKDGCLVCGGGVFGGRPEKGSLLEGQRFPDWDIVFEVMKVMGGVRMTSRDARKAFESTMRGVFFNHDGVAGGRYCVLAHYDMLIESVMTAKTRWDWR